MSDNRRRTPRQKTFKSAKILLNNRASVIDCLLRNVSETGAQLQLSNTAGVPSTFELAFDNHIRACTVQWRHGSRLGVSFSQE